MLGKPFGQRRRLVAEHQGVAVDGAHDRACQHHLGGAAALTDLLAHRRPHAAHRSRVRVRRPRSRGGDGRLHHRVGRRPHRRGRRRRLGLRRGSGSASGAGDGSGTGAGFRLRRLGAGGSGAVRRLALAGVLLRRRGRCRRGGLSPAGIDMSSRVSMRSTRCSSADSVSLADGSSSRAHTTSSSSRGAVAPRISPSPACTTSAYRVSVAVPIRVGLIPHPLQHVLRPVDHTAGDRVGHRLQHDQIAEALQQIGGEPPRVVAGIDHRLDGAEQRRRVPCRQRVDRVVDQRHVRRAKQRQRPRVRRPGCLRTGQQLVQHRQGVAGRPAACPDHQRVHRVVDRTSSCAQMRSSSDRMVRGASSRNG